MAKEKNPIDAGILTIGDPSRYACPECHGVLLEIKEAGRARFRCHTGHAYSAESLISAVSDATEEALWNAIRALDEVEMLMKRMSEHFEERHDLADARRLAERAEEVRRQSDIIRMMVTERDPLPTKA